VDWIYRDPEILKKPDRRPGSECELVRLTIEPTSRWHALEEPSTDPRWGFLEAEGGDGCGAALAALRTTFQVEEVDLFAEGIFFDLLEVLGITATPATP
jgi:hypothetical protein